MHCHVCRLPKIIRLYYRGENFYFKFSRPRAISCRGTDSFRVMTYITIPLFPSKKNELLYPYYFHLESKLMTFAPGLTFFQLFNQIIFSVLFSFSLLRFIAVQVFFVIYNILFFF